MKNLIAGLIGLMFLLGGMSYAGNNLPVKHVKHFKHAVSVSCPKGSCSTTSCTMSSSKMASCPLTSCPKGTCPLQSKQDAKSESSTVQPEKVAGVSRDK